MSAGPQRVSIDSLAAALRPGERVFLAGSSGEATPLLAALASDPERTRGLRLTTSFIPGMNQLDPGRLHPEAELTGLFMQPGLRAAQREGRYRHLPVSYSGFVRLLRERLRFDTCVVQVTPPDAAGRCSLGTAVEFAPEAMRRSDRVVAVVNPRMPHVPTAPSLAYADLALAAEAEFPLRTYDTGAVDAQSNAIADAIARFIDDGAALQVGLGKVPAAVMQLLQGRRGLRLQSGMLSDGAMALAEGGMLDPGWRHATCVLVGTAQLYDWAAGRRDIHVRGCEETHDPVRLAATERLIAVNSALEVDLFGQCNLEFAGGRAVSGPGGAPDFAYAASHAPGGVSIVALPATFGAARTSRIVARLGDRALASLPRTDVDVVVTEHGAADLRGRSVHGRAEALIGLADPAARADLEAAWREIAARI